MPSLFRLVLLCLFGFAVLVPPASAQEKAAPGERLFGGYTEAQIEAMIPGSSNPYLSFLPDGAAPDYRYWNARMALDAYQRADRRGRLDAQRLGFVYEEEEPDDMQGQNDSPETAEPIGGFGTGGDDANELTITGVLVDSASEPVPVEPFPEDDGALPLASDTGLELGDVILVNEAQIGDGPFGGTSGDFDWYAVTVTAAGQTISADVDTPIGDLDSYLGLYNSSGDLIGSNDDSDGLDSFLEVLIAEPGTYYVVVFSYRAGNPFQSNPNDSGSGPGANSTGPYDLTLALFEDSPNDRDVFSFELEAGDVISVGEGTASVSLVAFFRLDGSLMIRSGGDASGLYPEDSPLPSGGASTAVAAIVAEQDGTYALAIDGGGPYSVNVFAYRPRTETEPGGTQRLFIDFDGATINAQALFGTGNTNAVLSPLSDFVTNWGFDLEDEDALIDAILASVEETVRQSLIDDSNNPNVDVLFLNSRDDDEPADDDPLVSRLIVGGTIAESGIGTIGIASSIDPGNFGLDDTAIILLDLLSAPANNPNSLNQFAIAADAEKIDFIAQGIGNITAHEAGHFLGLYHTDQFNSTPSIIDQGGNLAGTVGVGADNTFGTDDDVDVDFIPDTFNPNEGFEGTQDQTNIVAFGLTAGLPVSAEPQGLPTAAEVSALYPNPLTATGTAVVELRAAQDEALTVTVYDVLGRRVRTVFDGIVGPSRPESLRIEAAGLAPGTYLVRIVGEREAATRRFTVVR